MHDSWSYHGSAHPDFQQQQQKTQNKRMICTVV